ncbi:MAG: SDR family oxidoreductase [Pseudomonadota bacterium]
MADQQVAVITGGASGIGAATARQLAAAGYGVALLDVADEAGEALSAALRDDGAQATYLRCDVSDENALNEAAETVAAQMGPAQALVTSAGLIPNTESILEMDMAAHQRMWDVNYNGTVHAVRAFAPGMIAAKRGAIVTLGSINSRLPLPLPAYNPGKAAIERLTQLLAVELGRHEIRVNAVGPTYVMTPPLQAAIAAGKRDPDKIMGVHALPRLPEPDDIAAAIHFLLSDAARAITGVLLPVDAGWLSAVSYRTYAGGVPWET